MLGRSGSDGGRVESSDELVAETACAPTRRFFSRMEDSKVEKTLVCASCGAEFEPEGGPGRLTVYCSEPCRRMAEYRIRAVVRRVNANEIELRELKSGGGMMLNDEERTHRMRVLRRWIKRDNVQLRALLGAKPINGSR
jgi:hypothetical protein